MPLPCE